MRSCLSLLAAVVLLGTSSVRGTASPVAEGTVVYRGGRVSAVPPAGLSPGSASLSVVETENCPARRTGSQLDVPADCPFLRGVYRYGVQSTPGITHEYAVEFTVTRNGRNGYAFIAAAPLPLGFFSPR